MIELFAWVREFVAGILAALLALLLLLPTSAEPPTPRAERPTASRTVVFGDDFTGAAGSAPDGALWRVKVTDKWQPAAELQTYTTDPANAHLDGNGHLVITALAVGDGWTSARLHSRSFLHFGRFEARTKMPTGAGAWGAFWTLGDDSAVGWPACGEIDVVELPAAENGRAYAGTHQTGVDGGHVGSGSMIAPLNLADPGGWHTYAVDWQPGRLDLYTDGALRGSITREAIEAHGGVWLFDDQPQQIILNLAVGGWGGTPGAWSSQTMLVDYVRVTA